jgi:hypothetical protein
MPVGHRPGSYLVTLFPNPYKAGGESVQGQACIELPFPEYIVMFMQKSRLGGLAEMPFPAEQGMDFCEMKKVRIDECSSSMHVLDQSSWPSK